MNPITYDVTIYPFKQSIIIFQLLIAIGLPFGILVLFLIYIQAVEGIVLVFILLLLSMILIILMFKKIRLRITIDSKGIKSEPSKVQLSKNNKLNIFLIFVGTLSKIPIATSIGILSQNNQVQRFTWSQIKSIKIKNKSFICTNRLNQKIIITPQNNHDEIKEALNFWGKGKFYA